MEHSEDTEIAATELDGLLAGDARTLVALMAAADLPEPPIPAHLEPVLRGYDSWLYATRVPEAPLYDVEAHMEAMLDGWDDDRLLIAHDGHGLNSWALHYYLKTGDLAVLLQLPWGGALGEPEAEREAVKEAFDHVAALVDAPRPDRPTMVVETFDLSVIGEADPVDRRMSFVDTPLALGAYCERRGIVPSRAASWRQTLIQA